MDMDDENDWYPAWSSLPSDDRQVAVLIALKDGTFLAAIGRYYPDRTDGTKWSIADWPEARVAAWFNLPDSHIRAD